MIKFFNKIRKKRLVELQGVLLSLLKSTTDINEQKWLNGLILETENKIKEIRQ